MRTEGLQQLQPLGALQPWWGELLPAWTWVLQTKRGDGVVRRSSCAWTRPQGQGGTGCGGGGVFTCCSLGPLQNEGGNGGDVTAPLSNHFAAGCQGFHCVTQILPIRGDGGPHPYQLLADFIQVNWSTGDTPVDYLVPNEAKLSPPGQATVARYRTHWDPLQLRDSDKCFICIHCIEVERQSPGF